MRPWSHWSPLWIHPCHGCRIFILCEIHCYWSAHIFWVYYFSLSQCDAELKVFFISLLTHSWAILFSNIQARIISKFNLQGCNSQKKFTSWFQSWLSLLNFKNCSVLSNSNKNIDMVEIFIKYPICPLDCNIFTKFIKTQKRGGGRPPILPAPPGPTVLIMISIFYIKSTRA